MNIKGKILVFTDLHLGLKSASRSRLMICVTVIKEIIKYIKAQNISAILFLGDWNHVRVSTENNVLNVSYKLMQALAKQVPVYCILGNHDIYMKNSLDINSMIIFKDLANVHIIDKPTEISINDNRSLLVPWLGDITAYKDETFDMLFGHFDISHQYLVKSYVEDHVQKAAISDELKTSINNDSLLTTDNISPTAGDYVGDFVNKAKISGTVFSGHIHARREFLAKRRNFILVGDPYQQNLGERDNQCGFYVIDENNKYKFVEITATPKHIQLLMSKVCQDYSNYDFSIVKGNILHKVYDVEVDRVLDAKISQKINDWHPYEELLPDYKVDVQSSNLIKLQNESIELIKKSKLDYVKNYIANIDINVLKEQNIDSDRLFNILKDYYNSVVDEK